VNTIGSFWPEQDSSNWESFLCNDINKTELLHFLADKICEAKTESTVVVTKMHEQQKQITRIDNIFQCNHEGADIHIFVHAIKVCSTCWQQKPNNFKANDTDIIVIAWSLMPLLQKLVHKNIWVGLVRCKC